MAKTKTLILNHFRNKYQPGDWRLAGLADDAWTLVTLKAAVSTGKQHVVLQAGTEVCAQAGECGRIMILHTSLLCPTSLGPRPARYVTLAEVTH